MKKDISHLVQIHRGQMTSIVGGGGGDNDQTGELPVFQKVVLHRAAELETVPTPLTDQRKRYLKPRI